MDTDYVSVAETELRESPTPRYDRPHGVDADWLEFRSNPHVGVKSFDEKHKRDMSYDICKDLSQRGLTPEVYAKFDYKDDHGNTWYCMVMERVELLTMEEQRQYSRPSNPQEEQLDHEIREYGYDAYDLHCHNVGKKNGRLVVIDVGHFD